MARSELSPNVRADRVVLLHAQQIQQRSFLVRRQVLLVSGKSDQTSCRYGEWGHVSARVDLFGRAWSMMRLTKTLKNDAPLAED